MAGSIIILLIALMFEVPIQWVFIISVCIVVNMSTCNKNCMHSNNIVCWLYIILYIL